MKIVCICEDSTVVNLIRSGLVGEHDVPLIIMPEFGGSKSQSLRSLPVKQIFAKLFSKVFFSVFRRRPLEKKLNQIIENISDSTDSQNPAPTTKEIRMPARKVNSKSTAKLIADCEPDLMFVCGAPILKKTIFGIPKFGSVNFHFGYSPKYRGHHCLLWAFINRDYKNLAGTFLKIDRGVDTGTPLGFVFPRITGADTIENVESQVAIMAKNCISDVFANVACKGKLETPEPEQEFLIKFLDYGPLVHAKYLMRIFKNRLLQKNQVLREQETLLRSG